ncbi:Low affinity immunoglobulin epsilon Fc receptor [Triplophysa tibetana]|nr:Low affinity immunoglobulin epsilon Fc receptor [Triplophysa tibetana]
MREPPRPKAVSLERMPQSGTRKVIPEMSNCSLSLAVSDEKVYLFSGVKQNWSKSRDVCLSKGADLVTITSYTEQVFIASHIKESFWIGLNDLDTEGRWVWVNNQTLNETGVQQLMGNISRNKDYLSSCQKNWSSFQGKMYFFSSDKHNWSNSRGVCLSKGADLVTITSQAEQVFLYSQIKETRWIGLNDLETEGQWVWVNNQTLEETGVKFWHKRESGKNEPDNWKETDPSGENCASMQYAHGFSDAWFDQSCQTETKFICEKRSSPYTDDDQ